MSQNAFAQIERETNEAEGLREHARMERMEMTEQKKDYSKLRQFDLEAAKRGEPICDACGNTFLFIAEAGEDGEHAIRAVCGNMALCEGKRMRMKPLAFVEGKPVYKGDVLYRPSVSRNPLVVECVSKSRVSNADSNLYIYFEGNGGCEYADNSRRLLTWNPPKVKREVKLLAYLDADQLLWLRETATPKWPAVRVQSEDKTIEVEW